MNSTSGTQKTLYFIPLVLLFNVLTFIYNPKIFHENYVPITIETMDSSSKKIAHHKYMGGGPFT